MAEEAPLLVEIGTEELPPRVLRQLMDAFASELVKELDQARLNPQLVKPFASPRRLAVRIESIKRVQPDEQVERLGPKEEAALDKDGNWTKAAIGFARSCGVDTESLEVVETEKGRRIAWRGNQPGKYAQDLIPEAIEAALKRLPIPKRMRWGAGEAEFVRPIHWVVALLADEVVDGSILGIPCGRVTYGHRFHGAAREGIVVERSVDYEKLLMERGYVIADFHVRRQRVEQDILSHAQRLGGSPVIDDGLLDEITALVEWPVALTGDFDERFLAVPEEALISSMQGHQRCIPVRSQSGRLLASFIAVANIESSNPDEVRRGNERVIRPRLADAEFFWLQDRRKSLAERLDDLAAVTFHRRLGDLRSRSQRIAEIASVLAPYIGADKDNARRAGELCKADLVTEMVGEFPELQGIMGGYYAAADGEGEDVSQAIKEHYKPAFAGDQLPSTELALVVSVADRVDTLVSIFAADGPPSADKDPFALRRAAIGLLRCLIEGGYDLNLLELLETAAAQLPLDIAPDDVANQVFSFCQERLRGYYTDHGYAAEFYAAVAAVRPLSMFDFHRRLTACAQFWQLSEAESLAAANKRIRNILKNADECVAGDPATPPPGTESAEQELASALKQSWQKARPLIDDGDYSNALIALANLYVPINRFFDEVMVMDDDPGKRAKRLQLLDGIRVAFSSVADLSELPA
ncbi:glycyl-tRNA synthetase beta chain [Halorhodospira halochloris]|uniref:Glycine--tRNA ligase beta subunit n=1 Tax=Halorhodospira halochloris TaxID=1052 RepID=A0A0X8X6V5_HALHR|nr:glycine--tRNA ligase subunit beta [Halorhodospira halochloris]MBK1650825.1 glycine--tRNA ligase subunit beta [Halorhodospira halochloris]BAU56676.1 glycyl-tRNA synthetase beta chain [Halorhodospira halochloris]